MSAKSAKLVGQDPRKVVIAIFEGVKLLDVTGPLQVFADARSEVASQAYQVTIASAFGGLVATDAGIALASESLNDAMAGSVDTLLIAGGTPAIEAANTASLRKQLVEHIGRPRRLGSICLGAFVLAELGVLDGRKATTHWTECDRLQREYKSITVQSDAIYVTSGRIWTSAGVSAGMDLALAMVEEDLGHHMALSLARFLVLFLKRPGGQAQFSAELKRQMRDTRGRFDDLHDYIRANLDRDLSVPVLAAAANMSPRNFARMYHRETGESPARAVELIRVEVAGQLLESTRYSIRRIARRIGFGDDERMRRAFLKIYGVSPQDYRNRFSRLSR